MTKTTTEIRSLFLILVLMLPSCAKQTYFSDETFPETWFSRTGCVDGDSLSLNERDALKTSAPKPRVDPDSLGKIALSSAAAYEACAAAANGKPSAGTLWLDAAAMALTSYYELRSSNDNLTRSDQSISETADLMLRESEECLASARREGVAGYDYRLTAIQNMISQQRSD